MKMVSPSLPAYNANVVTFIGRQLLDTEKYILGIFKKSIKTHNSTCPLCGVYGTVWGLEWSYPTQAKRGFGFDYVCTSCKKMWGELSE